MLNPDHRTRKVIVTDHQAMLRRLAEAAPSGTPRRHFTLALLAGPQLRRRATRLA